MRLIGLALVIILAGGRALAPLAAEGQPAGKVPRVGILANGSAATSPPADALRRGLHDLGYMEGRTIAVVLRKLGLEPRLIRRPAVLENPKLVFVELSGVGTVLFSLLAMIAR